MRLIALFIIIFLNGCNPERVEKLGQSLETTANVLDVLTPVFNKLDEVIYDYEYKSEYKDGKRHGYGTYIWKDEKFKGTKYIGNWQQNQMHGKGTMFFGNGDRYVGEFMYDKFDGEGTYYYSNGTKIEGMWFDGKFQKSNTNTKNVDNYVPSYKPEYTNKSDCDATISSWCKEQQSKKTYKTKVSNNNSNHSHSHSSNVDKVSETEELGFWGKTDKFLGKIADGISKEDTITGLRTLDKPFHNEEDYRKQGEKTFNLILNKARKQNARILDDSDPQFIRAKNIIDRLVDASHYRNHKEKVKYAVIDYKDFNALAFGGGYFVIFTGLMNQTNDDELAYVIAHELAHNTAGHIEESFFITLKNVFGDKPPSGYAASFTNINEQEADRIAIIYTALAGFEPRGGATIWEKRPSSIEQYAFYRTYPPNDQRAQAVRYASSRIMKYYTRGVVNPNVEKILQCNELFCNRTGTRLADGKGGGFIKSLEVIADAVVKNELTKLEKKKQEQDIAQSRNIIANNRLLTPPNINWQGGWNLRYQGTINRHNQKSGMNFAFTQNLSQGQFYYNFNNLIEQGNIVFTGTNQAGYWFRWNDRYGQGNLQLREYTDGSLRGVIYIDDGTMLGRRLGDFVGYRK
tara:strand:+ start:884 stop:2770 length:1887 start_codon:yes stop_codon:yes gene_type:complete